ncbi:molybdate ABC transporter substrate-binding protein [Priestia megaterium]|uniref:molybdate ABC transporter substrate-binding protein n=1 Tax=Priestia megaterium TaxID=1404 RepID=UPI002731EA1C|nr:molybdate ABC transporter substrate-binding protein [Priestia megaterium]MDP1442089.1 molybdate ABC transporter substrate-binding protein [Priestia megaterium]MDP1471134.1 molybdate ABC transporter substrate-binding protein [Priestia megaterium]
MFKRFSLFTSIMMTFILLVGCSNPETTKDTKEGQQTEQSASKEKVEVTTSAAASLQDALTKIEKRYEKEHKNIDLKFNFGASGALKQQIEQGAPVDLFFSAAEDKFDELVQKGEIDKSQGVDLVGNDLVLVVPKDTKKPIKDFTDLSTKADKIALGTPDAVPAGNYAKQTLEKLNIWNEVSKKVVYAKDVRQVLSYVETGNVDAGIVYKTDALISDKVKIVATADEKNHDPIIYPVGIIKDTKHPKEAKAFYQYLQGKEALNVLKEYGFVKK